MQRLISGGMKSGPYDGNIVDIKREQNGKLLFRIELCNILEIANKSAKIQISPLNWQAQGNKADVIERNFVNGDLVRAWGIVSVSDQNGGIKWKTKNIEKLNVLVKEC